MRVVFHDLEKYVGSSEGVLISVSLLIVIQSSTSPPFAPKFLYPNTGECLLKSPHIIQLSGVGLMSCRSISLLGRLYTVQTNRYFTPRMSLAPTYSVSPSWDLDIFTDGILFLTRVATPLLGHLFCHFFILHTLACGI